MLDDLTEEEFERLLELVKKTKAGPAEEKEQEEAAEVEDELQDARVLVPALQSRLRELEAEVARLRSELAGKQPAA